ncbi:MAG: trigger factor [Chlamydia sp.]
MSDQEQTIEQRSNDNITVLFKTKPGCIIKMEVHVTPNSGKASYEKALKDVRKEISLPGFRKGKVPNEVVAKNFSNEIQRHYRDVLLQTAFHEAITLIGRSPFTTRSVRKSELKHEAKDGSAILTFEYEAMPEVPKVDLKTVVIEKRTARDPSEEELAQAMTKLKILHGERSEITGRGAQEGDLAIISISQAKPVQNEEQRAQKGTFLLVDHEQFYLIPGFLPDWLLSEVLGMNIGEKKEAEREPEKNSGGEANSKRCVIELHDLKTPTFAEETEELAKKANASSIDDLKEKIFQKKKSELVQEADELSRQELKNELILQYAFDLPQSLIEGETEARFRPYIKFKEELGETISNEADLRIEFQEEVKRYFTCLFLMKRIALEINPTFSQAEFLEEMYNQAFKAAYHEKVLYPGLSQEEIDQRILMNIMIKKCCDYCTQDV